MKTQIPIYRAKKIDSDVYVIGYLDYGAGSGNIKDSYYINNQIWYDDIGYDHLQWEIDPTTLAISFDDMIDSEGNRIFASLSEDGKGGDIINDFTETMTVKWDTTYRSVVVSDEMMFYELNFTRVKITGIQEMLNETNNLDPYGFTAYSGDTQL